MDLILIICFFVFVGLLVIGWAVWSYLESKDKANAWSIRAAGKSLAAQSNKKTEEQTNFKEQMVKFLGQLGQANKPKDQVAISRLKAKLAMAGYRNQQASVVFFGTRIFLAVLLGVIFLIAGSDAMQDKDTMTYILALLGCMVVGFYAPQVWLSSSISSRKERLVNGFPDSLDLMVVCVEAGLGLDQAISRVGQEVKGAHPDLGDEFMLLNLELRAGLSREQGLRNLVNRTDLEDIRSLVALLIQTDRFGTSIGQALRVHSNSMRLKRRLKAEEKGAQLPVKLMIPLILFIFPALMVVIMGPGAINLMRTLLPTMAG